MQCKSFDLLIETMATNDAEYMLAGLPLQRSETTYACIASRVSRGP